MCTARRPGRHCPQRLQLFLEVCAAVQFAHQRLVIHRDYQAAQHSGDAPTDAEAARLRNREAARARRRARIAHADGSPCVLTGRGEPGTDPRRADDRGERRLRARRTAVSIDDRATPVWHDAAHRSRFHAGDSARTLRCRPIAAAREGTRFDVSIELEWVVLKALRKEPDRRYASVEQLAEDIRRFLMGCPCSRRRIHGVSGAEVPAPQWPAVSRRRRPLIIVAWRGGRHDTVAGTTRRPAIQTRSERPRPILHFRHSRRH